MNTYELTDCVPGVYDIVLSKFNEGLFEDSKGNVVKICLTNEDSLIMSKTRCKIFVYKETCDNLKGHLYCMAHLHQHSDYSFLDGISKVSDIVNNNCYEAALTDHGACYGLFEFQMKMIKAGKKPILGSEFYCESINGSKDSNHLLVLAKTEIGLKNLIKLSSLSYSNFYKKPHISYQMLKDHSQGLIILSGCLGGEISRLLSADKYDKAIEVAKWFKGLFNDDYYIEIQRHNAKNEKIVNPQLLKLAKELKIKVVATSDSHYTKKEHQKAHEVALCVGTKKKLDEKHFSFDGTDYHILSDTEMFNKFQDIPEALSNTLEIAEKCNALYETGNYHIPTYQVPEGFKDESDYFKHLVYEGYKKRYEGSIKYDELERKQRLDFEINTVLKMGYPGYFLIVWDFIKYAKENGIAVGPGRGSAAGSLISYCLEITDLDPLDYGLLFERFLNPDRVSMPDIDVDFDFERRHEVIDYCKHKYGEDRVCNIVTFGTMAAKMCIKDVARVFNEYNLGEQIAKCIIDSNVSLKKNIENSEELRNILSSVPIAREIINIAIILEGNKRQTSTHACGIIISPKRVDEFVPTSLVFDDETNKKILTSQVTMEQAERLGLLKMDFLGLKTIGIINSTMKNNLCSYEKYSEIPIDDVLVYKELSKGNTQFVFQLESEGMTKFICELYQDVPEKYERLKNNPIKLKEYGKELFERLIAGVALYRPGPRDYIPDYIKGMKHPKQIVYDCKELEPILQSTYGVIIFQEQVMQIVKALAGFSSGQADYIRKAMSKKVEDILVEYREYFIYGSEMLNIKGCVENGISENVAIIIWDKMKDFGKYAFNRSHAAVYALLAYICAFQKLYYRIYFITACFNAFILNADKLKAYIYSAKNIGVDILKPDINKSFKYFTVENDKIRYGLLGLKSISNISDLIIENRKNPYISIEDFIRKNINIKKSELEALILSGVFDSFNITRSSMIATLPQIVSKTKCLKSDIKTGQISLFDLCPDIKKQDTIIFPNLPEFPTQQLLENEKKYAGTYITSHPLDEYIPIINKERAVECSILEEYENQKVTIIGIVHDINIVYTKKDNQAMCVGSVEDRSDSVKFVVFPKKFFAFKQLLNVGKIIIIKGMYQDNQIIVDSVQDIVTENTNQILYINCTSLHAMNYLEELIGKNNNNDGNIIVKCQFDRKLYEIGKTNLSSGLLLNMINLYGKENVLLK